MYIESRLENATEILNEINSTLYKYRGDLNDDLSLYFNKLIHFAYIKGINTFDKDCSESFCMVHRRNESNNIKLNYKDVESIIFGNYTSLSFADTKKKKNKNIDLNKKYLPNMGPLTKDDIFYYLFNIQNTLSSLNKTYLSKEYKNISRMVSNFINKVNFTYLTKLEKSFEISLLKFSTVLTEPSYEKLKKNIYKQYYQIENYINEISNYTKNVMDMFSNKLNNTSFFIKIINSQTFFKILGYYNILTNFMQSKIKKLDNFDLKRNLGNDRKDYYDNDFGDFDFGDENNALDGGYNELEDIIDQIAMEEYYGNRFDQQEDIGDPFNDNYTDRVIIVPEDPQDPEPIFDNITQHINELNSEKCSISIEKNLFPNLPMITIQFPIIHILQLRITPTIFFGHGFKFDCYNEKKEYGSFLNLYVKAEVSLNMELGFYIPAKNFPVELAIKFGLKGVLGSGTIGLKLGYNLNQNHLEIGLNNKFEVFTLYFYIQFKFTIDLKLFSFHFEFYIANERLFGLYKEEHKAIIYKFLK